MKDPATLIFLWGVLLPLSHGSGDMAALATMEPPSLVYKQPRDGAFVGTVKRVIDADTFVVCPRQAPCLKVRLAGIDAPERRQPGGAAATMAVAHFLDQPVVVVPKDVGPYGRTVADVVTLKRGIWINATLVCSGFAWAAPAEYNPSQTIVRCQQQAQRAKLGLWGLSLMKKRPWLWRRESGAITIYKNK
jgi:endonuclease YncB( thermonuclease family)